MAQHKYSLSFLAITLSVYAAGATVPAIFVFGDSTADVGTNNYLPVSEEIRADFRFNGIDFRGSKPTGRFSNGYNLADTVARLSGYKRSPPPFLYLVLNQKPFFKRDVLRGANFASGGSGVFVQTGKIFGKVMSMADQVQQFATICSNISQLMGDQSAETIVSKSLILISSGSNEIFEYFESNVTRNRLQFMTTLINTYKEHLSNLLDLGARRFGIISVSPVGCVPRFRALNNSGGGGCINEMNSYAQLFFLKLQEMLQNLSMEYKGMTYSLANSYDVIMNVLDNPLASGFKDVRSACCGRGVLGSESACSPDSTICENRNEFFFWDRYHPSQIASKLAGLTLYAGASRFVTPVNFSRLLENDEDI